MLMIERLFSIVNLLVMPFWFLMILLPNWRVTRKIIGSPWIAAPVAAIYAALVLPNANQLLGELANPSAAEIASLLGTPEGATIGWAHFLAFDLFVGRWIFLDNLDNDEKRRLHPLLMAPILFLTLMFGPLGLLLYLLGRLFRPTQQ